KTGTLNEQTTGGRIKSLVMAIGRADGASAGAALRCGLVAVTYFEFADDRRCRAFTAISPRGRCQRCSPASGTEYRGARRASRQATARGRVRRPNEETLMGVSSRLSARRGRRGGARPGAANGWGAGGRHRRSRGLLGALEQPDE